MITASGPWFPLISRRWMVQLAAETAHAVEVEERFAAREEWPDDGRDWQAPYEP